LIPRSIADEGTPRGTEYDVVPKLTEEARFSRPGNRSHLLKKRLMKNVPVRLRRFAGAWFAAS